MATAFTVLVLPQLPLSFANSCLATADAARVYFGEKAAAVRPGRLATSFGSANLFAGAIGGMPVCHGAGGLTAHGLRSTNRRSAARDGNRVARARARLRRRTRGAPDRLSAPDPRRTARHRGAPSHQPPARPPRTLGVGLALAVGLVGFQVHLALALGGGLVVYWGLRLAGALAAPARAPPRWTTGRPRGASTRSRSASARSGFDQLALWGNLGVSLLVLVIGASSCPP